MAKVKVIDKGWKKLQKGFKKHLGGTVATVGIQGAEGQEVDSMYHGDLTNVYLGAIHEFGWGNNPERSFIRSTFDEKMSKYKKESDKIARGIFGGGTAEGALMLLGEMFRGDIIKKINSGIKPVLQPGSLINRPGAGSTPLRASGQLVNSISSVVQDRKKVQD